VYTQLPTFSQPLPRDLANTFEQVTAGDIAVNSFPKFLLAGLLWSHEVIPNQTISKR
jgi:hypothetical protein